MQKFKKSYCLTIAMLLFSFAFGVNAVLATIILPPSNVESIDLIMNDTVAVWSINPGASISPKGYKLVWSKNKKPTYPLRNGDEYAHYYNSKNGPARTGEIRPSESGTYYVRVCTYSGDSQCKLYSNEVAVKIAADADLAAAVVDIKLISSGSLLKWTVDGYSYKGFKVVFSKTSNPTYPLRSTDKYHYYSKSSSRSDSITAFDGDGIYYARVCEYLGGKCGVYSNEVKVELGNGAGNPTICTMDYTPVCGIDGKTYSNKCVAGATSIAYQGECQDLDDCTSFFDGCNRCIVNDGKITGCTRMYCSSERMQTPKCVDFKKFELVGGGRDEHGCIGSAGYAWSEEDQECIRPWEKKDENNFREKAESLVGDKFEEMLVEMKQLRNQVKEQATKIRHLEGLMKNVAKISERMQDAISNFITYGVDENTRNLGEGERAAVMNSFKAAFGKLPSTDTDIEDAIKIANGRWPTLKSETAENKAKEAFQEIYKRMADMANPNDNAAVTVMSYGLRQKAENRNLNSERQGIKTFQHIFGHVPNTTEEWNTMQAITYSGATR